MSDLLREARELLHGAAEPGATQEKADIGMCAQWDVEALALVAKIDAQLAAPVAAQEPRKLTMSMFATLADLEAAKAAQKAQPAPAQGEPAAFATRYLCVNCGAQPFKRLAQCPHCGHAMNYHGHDLVGE